MRTFAPKPTLRQSPNQYTSAAPPSLSLRRRSDSDSILWQRTIGNQAVKRVISADTAEPYLGASTNPGSCFTHDFSKIPVYGKSPVSLQAKLTISTPGDIYEQEANRIAEHMMHMPEPEKQDACSCSGQCKKCNNAEHGGGDAPRAATESSLSARSRDISAPNVLDEAVRSDAQPLDENTRGFFERKFRQDFHSVRIHTGSQASVAAQYLGARAFTLGEHVVFGQGEYSTGSSQGRSLIAHELVHVVQQLGTNVGKSDASTEHSSPVALSAPSMLARGEKWDAFWDVGPFDAMKAKELADKSLAAARRTGLPGIHNGPADAWRHCYWNCLMTDELGSDQAQIVADNHEKHGGGPAVENLMDSRNNWEGRQCGGRNCDTCCQAKLDTGVLDVIEAGKMVPSKKTSRTGGKQTDKYTY